MEFKDAYFLLGNNINKYKGKTIGHKETSETYKVIHLYIGLKKPEADDFRFIEKNKIDFMGGLDTKVYSLLKKKPCKLFVKLWDEKTDSIKEMPLDKMEKEFNLK
jgi:hypothetical protein